MTENAPHKIPQTYLKRGSDGRYLVLCRICTRRAWRFNSEDERVGHWFDTPKEAAEQGRRHRQSDYHQDQVIQAARQTVTYEERLMAKMFGHPLPGPCELCGLHHTKKLDCLTAARVRDNELM